MIRLHPGDAYALAFALCQGAVLVFWKYFLALVPEPVLLIYWFGSGFVILGGYLVVTRKLGVVGRGDLFRLVLFATLSGLSMLLLMAGVERIGASLAAVVMQTAVIFVLIFAVVGLGERPSRYEIAGVVLIMCGHLVLNLAADAAFIVSALLVVGAAFVQAMAHYIAKGLVSRIRPAQLNLIRLSGGVVAGLVMISASGAEFIILSAEQLVILAIGVFIGPILYFSYYLALQRLNLSRASFLMNTQPMFTILIAYIALGETLNPRQWSAVGLILSGVYVIVVLHHRQGGRRGR